MSDFCNKLTYRYLTEAELPQAKKLWAICFPEDDEEFIDYYFAERTAESLFEIVKIKRDVFGHYGEYYF